MSIQPQIDGKQIARWAEVEQDEGVLRQLVARLLWASTKLRLLNMSLGSARYLAGWDGLAESDEGSTHCPPGRSGWELSTRADVKDKLDEDYAERTLNPAPLIAARASYVAVTAHRFPASTHRNTKIKTKAEWRAAKLAEKKWADVRLIDADDLAQWLAECPAVAAWFASEHLLDRRPATGITSHEQFLQAWSEATVELPLPPSLALAGRDEQAGQLRRWLSQGTAGVVQVQAATRLEARVFVAAVIAGSDEPLREDLGARTLVVHSREAWLWAIGTKPPRPLVLIPAFDDFDLGLGRGEHFVVVPHDREAQLDRRDNILLLDEPLPWRMVEQQLKELGVAQTRALQLAQQSGGQLHALRRLLGEVARPRWAAQEKHAELVALLLVGGWSPDSEGDRSVIERLGADPDELDRTCTRLTAVDGAPIVRRGSGYRWAAPEAAWQQLAGLLSTRTLQSFAELAIAVLGEDDPRFDKPANERFFASVFGDALAHSAALRAGMTRSLLHLSRSDDALRSLGTSLGSQTAERVVHSILVPHWKRWASLSEQLATLAEAAPRVFLDRLRMSLADTHGVTELFEQEGDPLLSGATPHVGLLWALEILAWDRQTMAEAANALVRLAEADPPETTGRVGNRPITSLAAIFHLFSPQTLADEELRHGVLELITQDHPEVGFELTLSLLETLRGGILPTSTKPKFDERVPSSTVVEYVDVGLERGRRVLPLAVVAAGTESRRWARLIKAPLNVLGEDCVSDVFDRLAELRASFDDDGATRICAALREELASLGRKFPRRAEKLQMTLDLFQPRDSILRIKWMFESGMARQELHEDADFKTLVARVNRRRDEALAQVLDQDSNNPELLIRLIEQLGDDVGGLGEALARSPRAAEFEQLLLEAGTPEGLRKVVPWFAASRFWLRGRSFQWLEDLLRHWLSNNREDDALATLMTTPSSPQIWDFLDEQGDPLRHRYWAQLKWVPQHDGGEQWDRVLRNLCEARNAATAFLVADFQSDKLETEALLAVLELLHESFSQPSNRLPGQDLSHGLGTIFETLDERHAKEPFVPELLDRVSRLELVFIEAFGDGSRGRHFLGERLDASPELFAELVTYRYRADDEPGEQTLSPQRLQAARNAGRILDTWRSYPGSTVDDPQAREQRLREWADEALALCEAARCSTKGQYEVAKVLARPPASEDGYWPCLAARELLKTGRYPKLTEGLFRAKRDQRGATVRGEYEGGAQELVLAEEFEQSARALEAKWSATVALLEGLAVAYRREAEENNQEAKVLRHSHGEAPLPPASREPPSEPDPTDRALPITHLVELSVRDVGPTTELSIEFAPRLTLITGDNSLGKTFLLDIAWWALTGTWPSEDRMARPTIVQSQASPTIAMRDEHDHRASSGFDRANERWPRRIGWPAAIPPVVYARLDDGFSVWDQLRNGLSGTGGPEPEVPAYHFSEHEVWNGLPGSNGTPLCQGLIADWRYWSQSDQREAFEALLAVVDRLSEPGIEIEPGPAIKLAKHDSRRIPTLKFPYGDVPLVHLSAGWRRIFALAYLLTWTWMEYRAEAQRQGVPSSKSIVVLIDEAEAHLHPKWQRVILPALIAAAEALEDSPTVQLVVTTHSPMVTASLETIFDQARDRVYYLELIERIVTINEYPWAKRGDASSWLESELFGLDMAMSKEAEAALNAAYDFVNGDHERLPAELDTQEKIDAALRKSVAESHPFWLRWALFIDEDEP